MVQNYIMINTKEPGEIKSKGMEFGKALKISLIVSSICFVVFPISIICARDGRYYRKYLNK